MFNEKQKEGFARVLDTLGASAIIGFFVSVFGYSQVQLETLDKCWLIIASVALPLTACVFRE